MFSYFNCVQFCNVNLGSQSFQINYMSDRLRGVIFLVVYNGLYYGLCSTGKLNAFFKVSGILPRCPYNRSIDFHLYFVEFSVKGSAQLSQCGKKSPGPCNVIC